MGNNALIVYDYESNWYYPVIEVQGESFHVTDLRIFNKDDSVNLLKVVDELYDYIVMNYFDEYNHTLIQQLHPWEDKQIENRRYFLEEYYVYIA